MIDIKIVFWLNIFKGLIFLNADWYLIDVFLQERFNKLIFGINRIIKCGIWQPVNFSLSLVFELDQKWNDFLLYLWINVGNINSEIQ